MENTRKRLILTDNADFSAVLRSGKRIAGKNIVFCYKKKSFDYNRMGISVSKKIGNSVMRNRAKRVIRAAYSTIAFPQGYDFVIIARSGSTDCKSYQIRSFLKYKVIPSINNENITDSAN